MRYLLIIILLFVFASVSPEDPPKEKKELVDSTLIKAQQNLKQLKALSRSFDSLAVKQDSIIKK